MTPKTKPSYLNPTLKKVSEEQLLSALREVKIKNEEYRREMGLGISKALSDGFRCMNFKK